MKKSYKRVLLSALVASMPMFAACERTERISSIETTDFAAAPGKARKVTPVTANSTASGTVTGLATHGKELTLEVAGFRLEIPKGTVRHPTVFTMTAVPGEFIKVRLNAYSGLQEVTQFHRPLTLTMPLSALSAEDLADLQKLVIGNMSEDGQNRIIDVAGATVDRTTNTITGLITHFSDWVVAKDNTILID